MPAINQPPSHRLRILVADDDDVIRDLITRILSGEGHTTRDVATGTAALQEILSGAHDLAILDVQMPGVSAIQVAQQYRQVQKVNRIPIIVLTADASPETGINCLKSGVELVLTKPVRRQQLLSSIDRVVAAHRASQSPRRPTVERNIVLDEEKVAELVLLDSTGEFQRSTLQKFKLQALEIIKAIGYAIRDANVAEISELVHKLEGGAATFGAVEVQFACKALREALAVGHMELIHTRAGELAKAINKVVAVVEEKYAGGQSAPE